MLLVLARVWTLSIRVSRKEIHTVYSEKCDLRIEIYLAQEEALKGETITDSYGETSSIGIRGETVTNSTESVASRRQ